MPRSLAINVAANTTLPGFRAPIRPDGTFAYVPIPEREPATGVPTYADLDLDPDVPLPADLRDRTVHLDPAFREYHDCEEYTYGDEHGVKAGPISQLSEGDRLLFYATLERVDDGPYPDWVAPGWGAYLIGEFVLGMDPVTGEEYLDLPRERRRLFAGNAHVRRDEFDAKVLVYGDPDRSHLFDRAVPLSSRAAGADANRIVTALSNDSGKGPWWRRPLRFDPDAAAELERIVAERDLDAAFEES